MVFDAIADGKLLGRVDRLTRARAVELLAALETMQEVARTPDPERRRRLQRVRVLVVAPPDPDDRGSGTLLDRLRASPGVSDEDARIAVTALVHDAPLVTEDRELRVAAEAHVPALRLWTWAGELEPLLLRPGGSPGSR